MKAIKFFKSHKMSVLSALLVLFAVMLGADSGFAMAVVDPAELAADPNPGEDINNRPAGEGLQTDEQGGDTQMQGKAATATDARDAGLEAEDYDADVDNFRKFRFPSETYFARRCKPVKVSSYVHGHYRSGSTDLEAKYSPEANLTITAGTNINTSAAKYNASTNVLQLPVSAFSNPECLTEFSTVLVDGANGYKVNVAGTEELDGNLVLFVMDHKDENDWVKFKIVNPPVKTTPSASTTVLKIGATFSVMASACAESQMHVASETYLPEKFDVYLQKKISTCVITDEFNDMDKKVPVKAPQVLANAEYNFKRKCAKSHWEGTKQRIDVMVPETGNREAIYFENGVLRQIPMMYTHGATLTDDDLLAMTTLMFTNNSMSEDATVFCGKKALKRFIKLVNSADKYRDVGKVEVNEYGIRVRNYSDNFGSLEFVWDPTLDDIGKEEYMVILDLKHATRPYKRNDSKTVRDMSKTGEAREAKEYNLCRIDCIALNGFNAVLVCPSSEALEASNLGGIKASFTLWENSTLDSADTGTCYVLKQAAGGFAAGDVIEYDSEASDWKLFEGYVGRA